MYNTCETGCCSSNVPIKDSSHAKCHCTDTHWCESPVIEKRTNSCDDGCCSNDTTYIQNSDEVRQYVDGLRNEHCGHSEHDLCRTINDISKESDTCCTPSPPKCGCSDDCNTSCGCDTPDLHYDDMNCNTANTVNCCSNDSSDVVYIKGLANRVRGSMNYKCHTYGNIRETIKEIPAADVFLVNHEFIDLLIDQIVGCLPIANMSKVVVDKVKEYVTLYYIYYKDIELVGSLVINDLIALDKNLITDPVIVGRTKAILYSLSNRLEGKINEYEQ